LREYLLKVRKEARLTQAQAAQKAGIDRSTYVHIERGDREPSLNTARRIAKAFGRTIEELFPPLNALNKHKTAKGKSKK